MATRNELVEAIAARYARSDRVEKARILDEFVAVTDFHRKHAMRLLRSRAPAGQSGPRPSRRVYTDAVREALLVLWEASDRICGKRLKALVPVLLDAMERHGHLDLDPEVRSGLLAMSAATIDRALRAVREKTGQRGCRRAAASSAVRRSIPLFRLGGSAARVHRGGSGGPQWPGCERQLHPDAGDIATGWCAPLLVREQTVLVEVLSEVRKLLPFELLGFDTDNDIVFMNETVRDYC
jgi:hypothetical protein